jgi:hypothetical protein
MTEHPTLADRMRGNLVPIDALPESDVVTLPLLRRR